MCYCSSVLCYRAADCSFLSVMLVSETVACSGVLCLP